MTRWGKGQDEIDELLGQTEPHLQIVTGAAADGTPLLAQARRIVGTAEILIETDVYSAYVLAYDAARFACVALLAQQGLRATVKGGHYAIQRAAIAQFGEGFRPFADMRRRRNELEYPRLPADTATIEEARQAVRDAKRLISAASALIDELSFYTQPGNAEPRNARRSS
jgi:uncharacterized protein (UPF0332 family)